MLDNYTTEQVAQSSGWGRTDPRLVQQILDDIDRLLDNEEQLCRHGAWGDLLYLLYRIAITATKTTGDETVLSRLEILLKKEDERLCHRVRRAKPLAF